MKLILSLLCVLATGGVATHAAPKPNIIVILADDLGWADLGCYGNPSAPLPRNTLYWHLPHYHHSTPASALRRDDWKLIEFFEDSSLELFNLRADPGEKTNLAASEPARAKELQAALAA